MELTWTPTTLASRTQCTGDTIWFMNKWKLKEMLIQSYRSGREETSLEVLRWFFVTGNSYLVLRLKLTWYFFSRNFLPSTQRKRLARGPRSLANSKFCIYVMPASEQKYYFSGNILIASGSHRQFLDNWGDLERYCGYREDNIPQLEDINRQISKSANQQISISAYQHISISANQHVSISANQLAHSTTCRHQQAE